MNAIVAKMIVKAYGTNEVYALHDYLEENQLELELLEHLRANSAVPYLPYIEAQKFLYEPKENYYKSLSLKSFLSKCKNISKEEFAYFGIRLGEYKHRSIWYHFDKKEVYLRNFCLNHLIYNKKQARTHLQNCMLIAKHFKLRTLLKEINQKYDDLRWMDKYTEPNSQHMPNKRLYRP